MRLPAQIGKRLAQISLWLRLPGFLALLAFALTLFLAPPAAKAGAPGPGCGVCLTQTAVPEHLLLPLSEEQPDPFAPQTPANATAQTFAEPDEAPAFEAALPRLAPLCRLSGEAGCLRPEASFITPAGGCNPPLRPPTTA